MRTRTGILTAMGVSLLASVFLGLLLVSGALAQGRSILVTPGSGGVGTNITVTGFEFATSTVVTVTFDGVDMAATTSDETGGFTVTFQAPTMPAGSYVIQASDVDGAATSTFTIEPFLNLGATSGPVGATVTLGGSGFAAETSITVTFASGPVLVFAGTTTGSGTWNGSFDVPPSPAGAHTLTATDAAGNTGQRTFTVTPEMELSVSSGPVGTAVTSTGTGFAASSAVTITFASSPVTVATATTDESGNFTAGFNVLPNPAGAHTVTATDAQGGTFSSTFTVTPRLVLSTNSGSPGTIVTADGTGYAGSSTVTVTFASDPLELGQAITDSLGSFAITFVVPDAVAGGHTVTATDASGGTFSSTFLVQPKLVFTPVSGPVGTVVTASGAGYAGSSTVTVVYASHPVVVAAVSSTDVGNFTATFNVPPSAAGDHTVVAYDNSQNSAQGIFSVIPKLVLDKSIGKVTDEVVATGTGYAANTSARVVFSSHPVVVAETVTDDHGGFVTPFRAAPGLAGLHTVTATDNAGNSASAPFTLVRALVLSSNGGPVGTRVDVWGWSWPAGETGIRVGWDSDGDGAVDIWFDTRALGAARADDHGSWRTSFNVPDSVTGPHRVTAAGDATSMSFDFNVRPSLSLSRRGGRVPTQVDVVARGFRANEGGLRLIWDGVTTTPIAGPAAANDRGTWRASFVVGVWAGLDVSFGDHSVGAIGAVTQLSDIVRPAWDFPFPRPDDPSPIVIPFGILPAAVFLNVYQGPVGTELEIWGEGFRPGETSTVTFGGAALTTSPTVATTDGSGRWGPVAGTVPVVPGGLYPVGAVASQTPPENVADSFFDVFAEVQVDPDRGLIGQDVGATGTGFQPGETVVLTWDGLWLPVPALVVGPDGSFALRWEAPDGSTPQWHAVAAVGNMTPLERVIPARFFLAGGVLNPRLGQWYPGGIQQGINGATSTDTIVVRPGTYNENVTIPTEIVALSLVSSEPLGATIRGQTSTQPVIDVRGEGLRRLEGFTLEPIGGGTGFHVDSFFDITYRVEFIGNHVRLGGGSVGIDIGGTSTNVTIADSTIEMGPGHVGIRADGSAGPVSNLSILRNRFGPPAGGAAGGTAVSLNGVQGAWLQDNVIASTDRGVEVRNSADVVIQHNRFNVSSFFDVFTELSLDGVTVRGNTFSGGTARGVRLEPSATGTVMVVWNNFAGGVVGVDNQSPVVVDAARNWWGHASAPVDGVDFVGRVLLVPHLLERVGFVDDPQRESIQAAIDAANGGGWIVVMRGEYQEALVINKPNLHVIAPDGRDSTQIIPPGIVPVAVDVWEAASGAELGGPGGADGSGFTIVGGVAERATVRVMARNVKAQSNRIGFPTGIDGASLVAMEGAAFGPGSWIVGGQVDGLVVFSNIIEVGESPPGGNHEGFGVAVGGAPATTVRIEQNTFVNVHPGPSQAGGVFLMGVQGGVVKNNAILGGIAGGIGVASFTGAFGDVATRDISIRGNVVLDAWQTGIGLVTLGTGEGGPSRASISDVRIVGNTLVGGQVGVAIADQHHGVFCPAEGCGPISGVVVRRNNIFNHGGPGISNEVPGLVVEAQWNFWGGRDGADGIGGDGVVGDVIVEPWARGFSRYVNTDSNPDAPFVAAGNPLPFGQMHFDTIQQALSGVQPQESIHVASGQYNGPVMVEMVGLDLLGMGELGSAVINTTASVPVVEVGRGADDFRLHGFTLSNNAPGGQGVRLGFNPAAADPIGGAVPVSDVTIWQNTINLARDGGDAISSLAGGPYLTVKGSTINGGFSGVRTAGGSAVTIVGNTMRDGAGAGVRVWGVGGDETRIAGNDIQNYDGNGVSLGADDTGRPKRGVTERVLVEGNILRGNGANGILLLARGGHTLRGVGVIGNDVADNQGHGLFLDGPPHVLRELQEQIVFSSNRFGTNDLFAMRPEPGAWPVPLTSGPASDERPQVSPDGTRVAFAAAGRDGAQYDIYVLDVESGVVTRLTDEPGYDNGPAWSPDGSRIVFTSDRAGGFRIFVMDADGSNVQQVTDSTYPVVDLMPRWSPDGSRIAFRRTLPGGAELFLVDLADTSSPVNITNRPGTTNSSPDWHPAGGEIAFASTRAGDWDIYRLVVASGTTTPLTGPQDGLDDSPSWSPNGSRIAFASDRGGNYDIYVMNADGSGLTRLTDDQGADTQPDWANLLVVSNVGVRVDTLVANFNNFVGNVGDAINNETGVSLDATKNFFGTIGGPTHPTNDRAPQGSRIYGMAAYRPWLATPVRVGSWAFDMKAVLLDAARPDGTRQSVAYSELLQPLIDLAWPFERVEASLPGAVFNEVLTINKADLQVVGTSGSGALVSPTASTPAVVTILGGAHRLVLKGFKFDGKANSSTIAILGGPQNVWIWANQVLLGAGNVAIRVDGGNASGLRVTGSFIEVGQGATGFSGNPGLLTNVTIDANSFGPGLGRNVGGIGVDLFGVQGARIEGNSIEGAGTGIRLRGYGPGGVSTTNVVIRDNVVLTCSSTDPNAACGDSIVVFDWDINNDGVQIIGNSVAGGLGNGIVVARRGSGSVRNASVVGNHVHDKAGDGIVVSGLGTPLSVAQNTVEGNLGNGVYADNGTYIVVGNSVVDNGGRGVFLRNANATQVTDNNLVGNAQGNLLLLDLSGAVVQGNSILGSSSAIGVEMRNTHGNWLRENLVRGHANEGVLVWRSNGNAFAANRIMANGRNGIAVVESNGNIIGGDLPTGVRPYDARDGREPRDVQIDFEDVSTGPLAVDSFFDVFFEIAPSSTPTVVDPRPWTFRDDFNQGSVAELQAQGWELSGAGTAAAISGKVTLGSPMSLERNMPRGVDGWSVNTAMWCDGPCSGGLVLELRPDFGIVKYEWDLDNDGMAFELPDGTRQVFPVTHFPLGSWVPLGARRVAGGIELLYDGDVIGVVPVTDDEALRVRRAGVYADNGMVAFDFIEVRGHRTQYLVNAPVPPSSSAGLPLGMTFQRPVQSVGMFVGSGTSTPVTAVLTAYDVHGQVIGSVNIAAPNHVTGWIGLTSPDRAIVRATLDYGPSPLPEAIDNLSLRFFPGNEVINNGGTGISLVNSPTATSTPNMVQGNVVFLNKEGGVSLTDSDRNKLHLNRVVGNGPWGISLVRSDDSDIVRNEVVSTGKYFVPLPPEGEGAGGAQMSGADGGTEGGVGGAASGPAPAAVGGNLRQINGAYSQGCSINTGLAFDGTNLLVSCWYHNVIDVLSPADGHLVRTITVSGYGGLGAAAWDAGRNRLWVCAADSPAGSYVKVILVNTADGSSQLMFQAPNLGIQGACVDGLAYDGSDDSIWLSPDVDDTIYHYTTGGTLIAQFPGTRSKLGGYGSSGIAVGGPDLFLANNGGSTIYKADKTLTTVTFFASFPRRLEDLECDDITFAGLGVGAMWSQDAYDRIINAWEIPAGLCAFGGGGEPGLREEKAGEQDVAIWLKDSHRSNIERNLADGGEIHLGELVIESLPAAVPAGESNAADGQGQGVTPAKVTYTVEGSQAGNVLVYTDDYQPSAGDTYVERALQELGISYTGYYSNPSGFCSALQGGGPWDMVLVSHNNYFQLGQCWTELEAWYRNNPNGRLIIETFDADGSNSESTTLWQTLGVAPSGDVGSPNNVYRWDANHPVFNSVHPVPDLTGGSSGYSDDGDRAGWSGDTKPVAGYTQGQQSGQAVKLIAGGGRAIVDTFIVSNFRNDQNGDGVPEAQALWANQIAFVLSPKGGRQTGIIMEQGSTFNVVHGNEVRNWKRNGIEVLGHSNDNDILRNSIHDVMGIGVQVFASVRTDILENHLFDLGNEESPAPAVGVFLWSTADANPARGQNVLQRNLLEDIWGYGIGLYRSSEETIGGTQPGQGNTLRRMVMGALLYESGRNLVAGNNFSQIGGSEESPGVAIYLADRSTRNQVLGNNVSEAAFGVYLWRSGLNTVQGNRMQYAWWAGILLYDHSDGNMVQGNTAAFGEGWGILVQESADNTIRENAVDGYYIAGIHLVGWQAQRNLVVNNLVGQAPAFESAVGNWYGIVVEGAWNNTIGQVQQGNTVVNSFGTGIMLLYAWQNSVAGNAVRDNGASEGGSPAGESFSPDVAVQSNPVLALLRANKPSQLLPAEATSLPDPQAVLDGARQEGGQPPAVGSDTSVLNGWSPGGIVVTWGSYKNTVDQNQVTGNAKDGIVVERSQGNVVSANTVASNKPQGIRVDQSGDTVVTGNVVYGHNEVGILARWSYRTRVEGNTVGQVVQQQLVGNKVGVDADGDTLVKGNTVQGNGRGIVVHGWSSPWSLGAVLNNQVNRNGVGVRVAPDAGGWDIINNVIEDNQHGIWLEGSETNIATNVIRRNTGGSEGPGGSGSGIHVSDKAGWNNRVTQNNIQDNRQAGSWGLVNDSPSQVIDARNNYWGGVPVGVTSSGPYAPGPNPDGSGDSVAGWVVFEPWLNALVTVPDGVPPTIVQAKALPRTLSRMSLWQEFNDDPNLPGTPDEGISMGPNYTNFVVEATDLPSGVRAAWVNLRPLVEQMVGPNPQIRKGMEQSWQSWLKSLERQDMGCWGSVPVCQRGFGLWEIYKNLEYELHGNLFETLTLGEFQVPVTVEDWSGNRVTRNIALTIVDQQIPIKKGWGVIGTPVALQDGRWSSVTALGEGVAYDAALYWDATAQQFKPVLPATELRPLEGIMVHATDDTVVSLIYSRNLTAPPRKAIAQGWNLWAPAVAPPQDERMKVREALVSIEEKAGDRGYTGVMAPQNQWFDFYKEYKFELATPPTPPIGYSWWSATGATKGSLESSSSSKSIGFGGYNWRAHVFPFMYAVNSLEWKLLCGLCDQKEPVAVAGTAYWVDAEHADAVSGYSVTPLGMQRLPRLPEPGRDLTLVPRPQGVRSVDGGQYGSDAIYRFLYEAYPVSLSPDDGGIPGAHQTTYVKYEWPEVNPADVARYYLREMRGLGWEVVDWHAGQDDAFLEFYRTQCQVEEGYDGASSCAEFMVRIDILGGVGVHILYQVWEPGPDLPDVPRYNWGPELAMVEYSQYGSPPWSLYTNIDYQPLLVDRQRIEPWRVAEFYLGSDKGPGVMSKFGWQPTWVEKWSNGIEMVFSRFDSRTYTSFEVTIRADGDMNKIRIWHSFSMYD